MQRYNLGTAKGAGDINTNGSNFMAQLDSMEHNMQQISADIMKRTYSPIQVVNFQKLNKSNHEL